MPLFSSLSVREGINHSKKLEKSPHSRRVSLGGARKSSVSRKPAIDEDASTRAIAGSSSRLMDNAKDPNPMTPISIVDDRVNYDGTEMQDKTPTPSPHDHALGEPIEDDQDVNRHSTASTWRENPAARKQGAFNGVHGITTDDPPEGQINHYGLTGDRSMDLAVAREKVQAAIEAELAADRAIEAAKQAVLEARRVVGAIEKQVNDEYVPKP